TTADPTCTCSARPVASLPWQRACSLMACSERTRPARTGFMKVGTTMTIKFSQNDKGSPAGKLADAELHFSGGPLDGLKLIGFGVWERRNGGRNVTFPARQYTVNGERRSFALLRAIV